MACLHDSLHEWLASLLLVFCLDLVCNAQLLQHGEQLLLVISHAGLNDGLDRFIDKLAETTLARRAVSLLLGPLLGLGVKKVVAPQLLHHLHLICAKLLGIDLGEGCEGEGPAMKTSAEGNCTLLWVHLSQNRLHAEQSLHKQDDSHIQQQVFKHSNFCTMCNWVSLQPSNS